MMKYVYYSMMVVLLAVGLPFVSSADEPTGFFRVDYDGSFTGWYNYEHRLFTAEVLGSTDGWLDGAAGVALHRGGLVVYPMLGLEMTNNPIVVQSYLGQCMVFYENKVWDIGSWSQYFIGNPISRFYFRDYVTYKVPRTPVGLGPAIEGTLYNGRSVPDRRILLGARFTLELPQGQFIAFVGGNVECHSDSMFRLGFRKLF